MRKCSLYTYILILVLALASCAPNKQADGSAPGAQISAATSGSGLIGFIPDPCKKYFLDDGDSLLLNVEEISKTYFAYTIVDGLREPKGKRYQPADLVSLLNALGSINLSDPRKPDKIGFFSQLTGKGGTGDAVPDFILIMPDLTTLTIGIIDTSHSLESNFSNTVYLDMDFKIPEEKGKALDKLFAVTYDR